tara:strand:+ start:804 stop:2018 length:1215 start_codon:yes stop_codon:yes gene_type:complete
LDLEEALSRLLTMIQSTKKTEIIRLAECDGRILSHDILAPISLPPFRSSAMDGYSVKRETYLKNPDKEFEVIGSSFAGKPFSGSMGADQCVRIFTGAVVPDVADMVMLQERTEILSESRVKFFENFENEDHIREIGNDIEKGTLVAKSKQQVTPYLIASLASLGVTQVPVFARPIVSIFSTGDELTDPENNESDLPLGEIYDANRTALKALLRDLPIDLVDLGILPDDKEKMSSSMLQAAKTSDLLVTSGGVSVGDADHVVDVISEVGKLDFWRLNLKPGKPLAYGSINNTPIIGLPGNPVSTIVTALLLLKPVITHLCGSVPFPPTRLKASLDGELSHQIGRAEYMRAHFTQKNKEIWVSSNQDQSSNRLSSFLDSNCLIEIPKEEGNVSAGSTVDIIPLNFI